MDRGQEPSLLAIVSHHILLAHQVELLEASIILPEEKASRYHQYIHKTELHGYTSSLNS